MRDADAARSQLRFPCATYEFQGPTGFARLPAVGLAFGGARLWELLTTFVVLADGRIL